MGITQNRFTMIYDQLNQRSFRKRLAPAGPEAEEKKIRCQQGDVSRDIEYKAIVRKIVNKN